MRAAPYIAYYCPPGISPPQYFPWRGLVGGQGLIPRAPDGRQLSPDGKPGLFYGAGIYDSGSLPHWKESSLGWWINAAGKGPQHCARQRLMPRGTTVEGITPDHRWYVPQLLEHHPEALLVCAADEIYRGGKMQVPQHLEKTIDHLRMLVLSGMQETPTIPDDDVIALAVDILALNYHISIIELDLLGWLSSSLVQRIITAASGIDQLIAKVDAMRAEIGQDHG